MNAQAYDTGNYRIDETSSRLQLMNQLDSGDSHFDFMPDKNGGDGEDDTFLYIWATGGVSTEYLKLGYESDLSPQRYVFETFAISGGAHHPIYFGHSDSAVMTLNSNGLNILNGSEITFNPGGIATTVKDIAAQQWNSTQSGTMKIRMGWTATNVLGHTVIRGFNYTGSYPGVWELHFGGYDVVSGPTWFAQGCTVLGNPPFQSVRCGFESNYPVLLLGLDGQAAGETVTVWNYPWAEIESVTAPDNFGGTDIPETGPSWTFDISNDEATDWPSITGKVDCPMHIAPGMEIVDNGDGSVNWELSGNSLVINGANVAKILNEDKTIYLRTTGDDSNGGYSSGDAFLTPERAITELHRWIAEDYVLTVNVGEGTFSCTSFDPAYAYGASTAWTGDVSEYTSRTINNIDGSATALITGLEYIDFDINLPAASGAAVGQFILVKTTSGGTNPNLVKGCHEIVTWNGTTNIATVRCVRAAGVTTLPSGTITADTLTLVKTVFYFSATNGLVSTGGRHCGNWDSMVFEGSTSRTGIWVLNGAAITLGANFGTSKWSINLNCQNGSNVQADDSIHSYSNTYLASGSSGGFMSLRFSILSGCRIAALRVFEATSVNFQDGEVYCGGASLNVQALRGGYITAIDSVVQGCTPSVSVAFYVTSGGGIDSSGASDDAATSRDQEAAPGGNGSYHVY